MNQTTVTKAMLAGAIAKFVAHYAGLDGELAVAAETIILGILFLIPADFGSNTIGAIKDTIKP